MRAPTGGRPRDSELDRAILEAASTVLGSEGLDGLSYVAVAARAGTTRPAVYRRYATIAELAIAAIAAVGQATAPKRTGDPLSDLTAELSAFRDGITGLNGIALAAAVLDAGTDPTITEAYRRQVVAPRRARIAAILTDAHRAGVITAGPADRKILTTMCTGSWYGYAVAGVVPPRDWPVRTARLVLTAGRATA